MKMNCALCFKGRTHFLGDKTQLHFRRKEQREGIEKDGKGRLKENWQHTYWQK